MDPFDDYDPQAYDYESDTQDDIVYLEGPPVQGEDPFLPYLAKGLSQLSQSSQQHEQEKVVPSLLPRRERQRRRTEQAAAQMMENESDSDLSNENPANNEEQQQDTFASLQSLLEKQSQQEKTPLKGDEDENNATEASSIAVREAETIAAVDTVDHACQPATMQETNNIHQSQSQFPVADEDWEPTQQGENPDAQTTKVPVITNTCLDYYSMSIGGPSSISSQLTRELQRRWKPRISQPMTFADPPSAVDSKLLSVLEKNRKRAQKTTMTSRTKKEASTTRPQFHKKRSLAKVTTSKSIVGTRPQHWGAKPQTPSVRTKKARKLAVSPKSSHLASSFQKPRAVAARQSDKNNAQQRSQNEFPNRISFAPHFFHSNTATTTQQDDVDDSTQRSDRREQAPYYQTPRILQRFNQNSKAAAYSAGSGGSDSGNRKKRKYATNSKKLKAGPLMKRLRALRSAVDGDTIRFQSGMYPFAQSATRRFDLSDPRNRATSIMDVSVVGEPVPWEEHERITVLGFVHHCAKTAKSTGSDKLVESGRFAWLSFTYDTAREQNVCKGSKLRIYNTVCVPSSSRIQIEGFGDGTLVESRLCDQTVLCTQLCEPYPELLPQLPDVIETNQLLRADNETRK